MLTLLFVLLFASCGDDDGGGGNGPSKEEFIEQADELCRETEEQGIELAEGAFVNPQEPTGPEAQQFIEDAVPLQRDLLANLRELDRPEGDEDEIERFLDAADEGTDVVEAAAESPDEALAMVQAGDGPLAEADQLAADYGLDDCSD